MIADSNRDLKERRENTLEQAALRRVATLVAQGVQPHELFAVVAEEVGRVVDAPSVGIARYESDCTATVCGTFPPQGPLFRTGTRVSLDGASVLRLVHESADPARIDDYTGLEGEIVDAVRRSGLRSSVGVPIEVAGRVWGAIVTSSTERLPENTEARLAEFTELVATAIANAEAREALARLTDEQEALRRLATLVAQNAAPAEIFAAVSAEVDRVFGLDPATFDVAAVGRFEPGPELVVVGVSKSVEAVPLGSRWPPDELFAPTHVLRTGRSARIRADDLASAGGEVAEFLRQHGYLSQVASPIVVDGRLWGAMSVNARNDFPPDTEERLERFTELVATAIANAKARETLAQLADEQAALRRVATLVAQGAPPAEVFAAVSAEVDRLLGLAPDRSDIAGVVRFDPGPEHVVVGVSRILEAVPLGSRWPPIDLYAPTRVLRTGRSARVGEDDLAVGGPEAEFIRESGYLSQVASPIVVDGRLWGAISANAAETLPPDTEERLEKFIELIATAIANTESREALGALADEQTALRRVATLVAAGAPPAEMFEAVSAEVAALIGADGSALTRYEEDGTVTALSGWTTEGGYIYVGRRYELEGTVSGLIFETGKPGRVDNYPEAPGEGPAAAREMGWHSSVGAPITVEGRLWGVLAVVSKSEQPLPRETEQRLAEFAELFATAIANAESRDALARLADEQAALRRVATLVARGVSPKEVFAAVAEEVGRLLVVSRAYVTRYESGNNGMLVAGWSATGADVPVGLRFEVADRGVAAQVRRTGLPARVDAYAPGAAADTAKVMGIESAVAAPISVEGSLWGLVVVGSTAAAPPAGTEQRLAGFTELVATAIGNAQAREELRRIADEQAALRRVATLVARDAPPGEVFDAVAMEVGKLLDTDITVVGRYDADGAATAIGNWSASGRGVPVGTRSVIGGHNVLTIVAETGRPARVDGYDDASGEAAEIARRYGWRSSIAAPIVVEDRLWGVMLVATERPEPFPARAEERLAAFTDLIATAVANAETKSELAASRRRIVAAADEARRRIERDLHDGIQQRLIALTFRARAMTRRPPDELPAIAVELSDGLKDVSNELREVSRGIHPTILTEAGLGPALRALARRSDVPVDVDVRLDERLPAPVEAAAYYIVSEALTNVAKHAHANVVELTAAHDNGILTLEVRDDGIGGVDATRGSGILGLTDRAEALGGTISIASARGAGTTLSVRLPITT